MKKIIFILMIMLFASLSISANAWVDRSRSFVYDRVSQDSYGNVDSRGYRDTDSSFEWNGRFWAPDYDEEWDEETSWNMHNEQSRLRVYEDIHTWRPSYSDGYYDRAYSSGYKPSSYYPNYYPNRYNGNYNGYRYNINSRYDRYRPTGYRYTPQSVGLYERGKIVYS